MSDTLLLTGASGVGKSTLIRKVARSLSDNRIQGFVSDEIWVNGRREGFRLDTFDGRQEVLAHTNIRSVHKLGRYGVDVEALGRVVDAALRPDENVEVFFVDEIGPMECFSTRFMTAMTELLDSGARVVATIHRTSEGFMGQVKDRGDVELWEVTRENRDAFPEQVLHWIGGSEEV